MDPNWLVPPPGLVAAAAALPRLEAPGDPAARLAALLAVGAHPRTGLARVALGSEASRIVHGSPVPVLVRPLARAA